MRVSSPARNLPWRHRNSTSWPARFRPRHYGLGLQLLDRSIRTLNSSVAATPPRRGEPGTAVHLAAVDVHLGAVPVLRGLHLEVAAGEAVAVTGPNGSGKSTLLRLLATLVPPSAGHVELFGQPVARARLAAARRTITYIGHEPALHPDLTLSENLELVARLAGRERQAADAALGEVGLSRAAQRAAGACSAGMRRRVELARVLVCRPRLLLLDEPHAALDAAARELVDRVTGQVTDRGGAAVLVTHDPAAIARIAPRRLAMSGGRLVEDGEP